MDRQKMAAVGIGVVVATSVGGFLVGSRISSPAEVASRTAPPSAAPILVPIEERVLSSDVVTRGTGRFGSPQKLSVANSSLKPGPGIVAHLPVAGAELAEGAVAVSASGRPLFVLVGARPMSRDLGPGLEGDDVRQLEESLARLGFDVGEVDGRYDERTEAGVAGWYEANGFAPFTATPEQLTSIRGREAELATASVEVLAADNASGSAGSALTTARAAAVTALGRAGATARAVERSRAEAVAANTLAATEMAARQATLDALRAGTPVSRGTPTEVAVATADRAVARANEAAVRAAGNEAVALAQANLDQAPTRVAEAGSAAVAAEAVAVADAGVKQAALDAAVADPSSTEVQRAVAGAELAAAQAAADSARVAGANALSLAESALDNAPSALEMARTQAAAADAVAAGEVAAKQAVLDNLSSKVPVTPGEIATAERELAIAQAGRETVRLSSERSEEDAALAASEAVSDLGVKAAEAAAAERAVANAALAVAARGSAVELAAMEADLAGRRAGVQVPADEVVFVATGPVHVSELLVGTGDPVVGGILRVTDARVHVDGALAVADAALVSSGMPVRIEEPDLGISAEGVVTFLAPAPGTNGVDGFHIYFEIDVATPPPNLVGSSVRLTIPVSSSGGAVLAVPVSALTLAPDGSSRVQLDVGGVPEFVTVEAGLSANGFVAITPNGAALAAGDLVVVGIGASGG